MKLKVGLNKQSIKNTINALKTAKKQLQGEMLNEFYKECYNYFVSRANYHLLSSGVGDLVIAEIQSSWHFEKTLNGAKFTNDAEKAVYVEFGVGIIGQTSQHPNADATNYEYNVDSEAKFGQGYWQFSVRNDEELDIPQEAITYRQGQTIITQGTEGVWYLYNAVEDFKLREQERLWKELTRKYLG
jgi:hypothetical protein